MKGAAVPATRTVPEETTSCLVLSCSPRAGGNSDTAARLFSRAFDRGREAAPSVGDVPEAGAGAPNRGVRVLFLRDYAVSPCTACDACVQAARELKARRAAVSLRTLADTRPFPCPAAARDDSTTLFGALAAAEQLCLVSPVYWYHLPAQFKALVDRIQVFRSMREYGGLRDDAPKRPCRIILIGGRPRGKRLFAGSLLSLKSALATLNSATVDPLLLYGLDADDALCRDREAAERIDAYGLAAGARPRMEHYEPA
ncbi:MAG: NAD(P)H-dependent oxidoreductase [Desulfovibrio sp.]|jgi:multimeric flavodoxin WrbA|nr:NAD(P)H-dependent oxidoreductase [Desulfovibrio sp.]